jgi:hypothetical protein
MLGGESLLERLVVGGAGAPRSRGCDDFVQKKIKFLHDQSPFVFYKKE